MSKRWFTDEYLTQMQQQYPNLSRDDIVDLLKQAHNHNKRSDIVHAIMLAPVVVLLATLFFN